MQKMYADPKGAEPTTDLYNRLYEVQKAADAANLSPEELVWLAESSAELTRDILDLAAAQLTARERRYSTRLTLGEHKPFNLAQNVLELVNDQAANLKQSLAKAQRRLLSPLGYQGDLRSYRAK